MLLLFVIWFDFPVDWSCDARFPTLLLDGGGSATDVTFLAPSVAPQLGRQPRP